MFQMSNFIHLSNQLLVVLASIEGCWIFLVYLSNQLPVVLASIKGCWIFLVNLVVLHRFTLYMSRYLSSLLRLQVPQICLPPTSDCLSIDFPQLTSLLLCYFHLVYHLGCDLSLDFQFLAHHVLQEHWLHSFCLVHYLSYHQALCFLLIY